jgi:hypothetical protein
MPPPARRSVIHSHKNTVLCCDWNVNGNWLATGSRDFLVKLFDIRTMREFKTLHGQNKEVCTVKWHPNHETCLVSGGFNGSLAYWVLGHEGPHTVVGRAQNYSVNVLEWHPLGHVLATAANDGVCKFWCREPPGSDLVNDAANPMFSESSTAGAGLDPLATLYGPVAPAVAATVLPQLDVQTNSSADAVSGGAPHEGGYGRENDGGRGAGRFSGRGRGDYGGRHAYGGGGEGGRGGGGYAGRGQYQPNVNSDSFDTSSVGSGGSYSGRGGGRGRGRGGGRFSSGGPPPPAPSPYGPAPGGGSSPASFHNQRAATDFMSSTSFSPPAPPAAPPGYSGAGAGPAPKRSRFSSAS